MLGTTVADVLALAAITAIENWFVSFLFSISFRFDTHLLPSSMK
jgi:hypothetical protein